MVRLSKKEKREIVAYAARAIEYSQYSMRAAIESALEHICPRAIWKGVGGAVVDLSPSVYSEIERRVRAQVELDQKLAQSYNRTYGR